MRVRIYDGSNYYRICLENDPTGLVHRTQLLNLNQTTDPIFYIWDGKDNKKKRLEKYPEYKAGRKPMGEDIFQGMNLFKEVLKHSSATQITVPEYEADDVIATLANRFSKQGLKVSIYSNDKDFLQIANDNIIVGAKPIKGVTQKYVRLYKTFVGDSSDNIKGLRGFGQKTWEYCNQEALLAWAEADFPDLGKEDCMQKFKVAKVVSNALRDSIEQLKTYWEIIAFYEVPMSEIEAQMIIGQPNYAVADKLLKEVLL